jgi:photosystem II stability/assembly factor-like uncharacterized protein
MRSSIRLVISFAIACVGGLATALVALPAAAGTNSWTVIRPDVANNSYGAPFAVAPSSPSTIYSVVNGTTTVTKTIDGGGNWTDLANGPPLHPINSLVIDPASPATIYAVGGYGASIYKSIDGGANWAAESNGLGIQSLAIAPSLSSTLYAGSSGMGVLKSIDGGLSWAKINNGLIGLFVSALAIDPTNADAVYVAIAGPDAKIFKLTQGTDQWRRVPISFPAGAIVGPLTIDPVTPSIIYAAYEVTAPNDVLVEAGIFKSIDSGETWMAAQNPPSDTNGIREVGALAIDPTAPWRIYAVTNYGVYMSTDAAASWTPINSGLPSLFTWGISIDRTGSILRTASYAGLFEYRISGPSNTTSVPLIEYFHAGFDHYFITSIPDEISKLDHGAFAGWVRTGFQFNAYAAPKANSAPVCRFFSAAFAPKSSHFYTPSATECAARRADSAWTLESTDAFDIGVPAADGSCAAGLAPIYRLYNNGQGGAPNHRYTIDLTVRAQMIAQGWVPEGLGPNAVEMCSPP